MCIRTSALKLKCVDHSIRRILRVFLWNVGTTAKYIDKVFLLKSSQLRAVLVKGIWMVAYSGHKLKGRRA